MTFWPLLLVYRSNNIIPVASARQFKFQSPPRSISIRAAFQTSPSSFIGIGRSNKERTKNIVSNVKSCYTHNLVSNQQHVQHCLLSITSSSSTSRLYSSDPLKTLAGNDIYAAEEVIKKSRFIGFASHCTSWGDTQSILETIRKEHPKSRHVCFGFVSSSSGSDSEGGGVGVGTERCSDDGEPTGTAGVPILSAIKGDGLSDTICIIVRRTCTGRIYSGQISSGDGVKLLRRQSSDEDSTADASSDPISQLSGVFANRGVSRVALDLAVAYAGDIATLTGVPETLTVGDTLTTADNGSNDGPVIRAIMYSL